MFSFTFYFYAIFCILCASAWNSEQTPHKYCKTNCPPVKTEKKTYPEPPKIIEEICNVEEVDNHLPNGHCSYYSGKKIINPYKNVRRDLIANPEKLSSACLKCLACLAIAQTLNENTTPFINEPEEYDSAIWQEYIKQHFEETAKDGFKNYDLRKFDDKIFFSPSNSKTQHVSTHFDGNWTRKLRDICATLVENIDYSLLYDSALCQEFTLENFMCRGEGLNRDCRNMAINITKPIEEDEEDSQIVISLTSNAPKENEENYQFTYLIFH